MADPQPDFSHTALDWDADQGVLVGATVADGRRAALRPGDLSLSFGDGRLVLDGLSLEEGLAWLSEQAGRPLKRPEHDLPDHAVATGGAFSGTDAEALAEIGEWFSAARHVIGAFADRRDDASPVRVWPHHFDLATLLTVREAQGDAEARTIGVGMSAGDGSYSYPYFYATPWPYPSAAPDVALPSGGRWHTEGWMGAVLVGSDLLRNDDLRTSSDAFVAGAVAAWTDVLQGG
jgi:hypothetical protein